MQLTEWWDAQTANARLTLAAASAVGLAIIIAGAIWATQPSYEVLFTGLDAQDASAIANRLSLEHIKYKLDNKEGRILVAERDLYDARVKVMEHGVPLRHPVGFELFDSADFGMTDFTQRINYQRALEGELTRTIGALDEVVNARLHLVLPEETLFHEGGEAPKASLTLLLKPGASLAPARVAGIQRLIAASVPGLQSEQVTIHDQQGVSLTGDTAHGPAPVDRLDAKRAQEAYLARKAQDVLDQAFGVGAAAVMVNVELDLDRRHIVRNEVLPVGGGVTGAVTRLHSTRQGIPSAPAVEDDEDEAPQRQTVSRPVTTDVEYATGRQEETVDVMAGSVKRITVGVLLPGNAPIEVQQQIGALVGDAVGVDRARGDSVSVVPMHIAASHPVAPQAGSGPLVRAVGGTSLANPERWLLGLLAGLFLVAALFYAWGRANREPKLTAVEREQLLADIRSWLAEGSDQSPSATQG
jgi:flagellar M-ring protein FliF